MIGSPLFSGMRIPREAPGIIFSAPRHKAPAPHIGASTDEAEDNCAVMAADQIKDFIENGNIKNSVNFPTIAMERADCPRLAIANRNIPKMLGNILSLLADEDINVVDMINKSRDDIAYNLIDVAQVPCDEVLKKILDVEGVITVRVLN
jgi:D-3-phosphoglycerate dehydrogenase